MAGDIAGRTSLTWLTAIALRRYHGLVDVPLRLHVGCAIICHEIGELTRAFADRHLSQAVVTCFLGLGEFELVDCPSDEGAVLEVLDRGWDGELELPLMIGVVRANTIVKSQVLVAYKSEGSRTHCLR